MFFRNHDLTAQEQKQIALDTSSNLVVIQRKKQLQFQAANFGLVCNEVPSDGLCFYHAIAHQFTANDKKKYNALQLKKLADHYILINRDKYRDYVDGSFYSYIMSSDLWADNIHIQALAASMNINIIILPHDGSIPTIIQTRKNIHENTFILGYETGAHYQSLTPADKKTRNHIIDMIVDTKNIMKEQCKVQKKSIKPEKFPDIDNIKSKSPDILQGVATKLVIKEMHLTNIKLNLKK